MGLRKPVAGRGRAPPERPAARVTVFAVGEELVRAPAGELFTPPKDPALRTATAKCGRLVAMDAADPAASAVGARPPSPRSPMSPVQEAVRAVVPKAQRTLYGLRGAKSAPAADPLSPRACARNQRAAVSHFRAVRDSNSKYKSYRAKQAVQKRVLAMVPAPPGEEEQPARRRSSGPEAIAAFFRFLRSPAGAARSAPRAARSADKTVATPHFELYSRNKVIPE